MGMGKMNGLQFHFRKYILKINTWQTKPAKLL